MFSFILNRILLYHIVYLMKKLGFQKIIMLEILNSNVFYYFKSNSHVLNCLSDVIKINC